MSLLAELKDTNPQQLITKNKELENSFISYLSAVQQVYDRAQQLIDEFFAEKQTISLDDSPVAPCFPIPVKEIAKRCNFLVMEMEMADTNFMEQDEYGGGRTTIAQMQMRERKQRTSDNGLVSSEIAGTIAIDKNLSEYAKRFVIAHELGHYVLRTLNPIGPLFIEDSCPGPFAYVPVKELLANEFAYALLLPYSLVKERKKRYEKENQYNPVSYLDWIQVLENEAQLPQHYVILAYEEIKKRQLAETTEARRRLADIKGCQRRLLTENERLKEQLDDIEAYRQYLLDQNEQLEEQVVNIEERWKNLVGKHEKLKGQLDSIEMQQQQLLNENEELKKQLTEAMKPKHEEETDMSPGFAGGKPSPAKEENKEKSTETFS